MGFVDKFNARAMPAIMARLGDEISFQSGGQVVNAMCVAVDARGSKGGDTWLDDVLARLDTSSVLVECVSADIGLVKKADSVVYQSKTYAVSDLLPQSDGMTFVVLTPHSYDVAAGGWK